MLVPFKDQIIGKRIGESNVSQKGAIRTSAEKEKPLEVEIIAANASYIQTGDRYLIARYSGIEVDFEGQELIFIKESDILAEVKGRTNG